MELVNNKTEHVSIYTVLSDFYEDNNIVQKDVDESLILKWAEDYLPNLITDQQLIHRLAWLSVIDYKVVYPRDLAIINEIAYRLEPPKDSCDVRGYEIVQYVQQTHEDCYLEMNVVCPSCHKTGCDCNTGDVVVDINTAFEVSHPELFYSKYAKVGRFGYGSSIYSNKWKILNFTSSDWFGINRHLPGCANIACKESPHSYKFDPPVLETSFQEGEILMSYMGKMLDDEGRIMIPKHRDVFEAILQHITYKWFRREYLNTLMSQYKEIYREAKLLRDEAEMKANIRLSTPTFQEFAAFWSQNKWAKMDSAYTNMLDGHAPISTIHKQNRNIYKS
ncbi:MAG: hypothetical protein J5I47_01450 [Vicingus serpentipes]|nr:hypothetical protein [Vicingus serpentipes]